MESKSRKCFYVQLAGPLSLNILGFDWGLSTSVQMPRFRYLYCVCSPLWADKWWSRSLDCCRMRCAYRVALCLIDGNACNNWRFSGLFDRASLHIEEYLESVFHIVKNEEYKTRTNCARKLPICDFLWPKIEKQKSVTNWSQNSVKIWLFCVRNWLTDSIKKSHNTLILWDLANFCPDLSG